jgi:transcriptional regulator with XRE-family HTH domain
MRGVSSIGEYIKEQREQAKISLRQLAAAAGVSNPYLSQIERGLRRPSAEILQQIAKGLRIRAAVLAEPVLTERQKQVLLEIYESFRKEAAAQAAEEQAGRLAEPGDDAQVAGLLAAAGTARPGLTEEEDDDPLAAPEPPPTDAAFQDRASASESTSLPPTAGQER